MEANRYERVMQIVDVLMDCDPAEQKARILTECSGDESLRREVEKLLAADRRDSVFMEESPLNGLSAGPGAEEEDRFIGKQVGPYRITEEIGRGGMGTVYKAVRDDAQYHTEVAIKLIKRGMDTDFVLERFRNERQILANLNHPNIARLLDGGSTEDGLPYFVMEYIDGQPLDKYCSQKQLSTVERLKLFRTVCGALSYAHRNLIIHRDLKPSNILVTEDGAPKLLDFGIAKLLDSRPEPANAVTAVELRAMTPEYASPEQVKGEPMTTSSDVYSMGVLLYEILTGHRPYRFKNHQPEEVARVVSEVEPERPSTAVSRAPFAEAGNSTNGVRTFPVNPEILRRTFKGDIDNIVLKALRKNPERRYSSIDQLAQDISNHLEGLPVSARRDTFAYRTQKFVQRHRAGVIAAGLVFVALVAGLATTLWQARVARAERGRAERRFNDVRHLANSFMFEFYDEIDKGPLKAKELMVKKALEYLDSLAKESGDDIKLQRELGTAYFRIATIQSGGLLSHLNDTKGSLESHRKALAIRERLAAQAPADPEIQFELASSYDYTAELVAVVLSKPADALEYFRKSRAILENLVAAHPNRRDFRRQLASTTNGLAQALANSVDVDANERKKVPELLQKGVGLYEALVAEDANDLDSRRRLASATANFANRLMLDAKTEEAAVNFRKALAVQESLMAREPSNVSYRRETAVTHSNLGVALLRQKDLTGSMDHARKALDIYTDLAAKDKNDANALKDLAIGYRNLGQAYAESGDRVNAGNNYRQAIEIFEALTAKNPDNAYNRRQLALTYVRHSTLLSNSGDLAKALDYAQQAVNHLEKLLAADAKNLSVLRTLADSYFQVGRNYGLMAAKTGATDRWTETCAWHQKSLNIFQDMKTKGSITDADQKKFDEVSSELQKCEAALKTG